MSDRNTQFHESFRVIHAESPQEAMEKSRLLGQEEECSFHNVYGEEVRWKFVDVHYLQPVISVADGAEVYSTTHVERSPEQFIRDVRINAQTISSHYIHPGIHFIEVQ